MASQITGVSVVYSIVCFGWDQRKHQSTASLAFVRGNLPVTGEFPAQRASNTENISIWWRHHNSSCTSVVLLDLRSCSHPRSGVLNNSDQATLTRHIQNRISSFWLNCFHWLHENVSYLQLSSDDNFLNITTLFSTALGKIEGDKSNWTTSRLHWSSDVGSKSPVGSANVHRTTPLRWFSYFWKWP